MKHTPGPWTQYAMDSYQIVGAITRFRNPTAIAQIQFSGDSKEDAANARLIAAAPDLLEALQRMVTIWEGPRQLAAIAFAAAIVDARAAIAKAQS